MYKCVGSVQGYTEPASKLVLASLTQIWYLNPKANQKNGTWDNMSEKCWSTSMDANYRLKAVFRNLSEYALKTVWCAWKLSRKKPHFEVETYFELLAINHVGTYIYQEYLYVRTRTKQTSCCTLHKCKLYLFKLWFSMQFYKLTCRSNFINLCIFIPIC